MKKSIHTVTCLFACFVSFGLAGEAFAQDAREAEIEQLEAILKKVEAARAALRPVIEAKTTYAQYDVRHLFYRPYDRSAPKLTIPSESAGYRTSAGGGFTFEEEYESDGSMLDPDQLENILVNTVGEDEWDEPRSIEIHRGYLLVRQTALGQARIQRLLARLKQAETRSVQLEVNFYALPQELQTQIETAALVEDGVLSPDVLMKLDASVKAGKARLTGSAMLTALNEQRVYLHQGVEQALVTDYENSSGGTGTVVATVADPIVDVLRSGLALDMRATLTGETVTPDVALDVRFIRSRPVNMAKKSTPWGELDMPRVDVDSVQTSARVPTGSGMLIFTVRQDEKKGPGANVTIVVRPRVIVSK